MKISSNVNLMYIQISTTILNILGVPFHYIIYFSLLYLAGLVAGYIPCLQLIQDGRAIWQIIANGSAFIAFLLAIISFAALLIYCCFVAFQYSYCLIVFLLGAEWRNETPNKILH